MNSLSDDELDRYARHLVLREVGGRGQALLRAANVAVIGAGGLGSPCLLYLAAAGVGRLTVIDDDDVALSNLQRQVLFTTADVGQPKAATAAAHLAALNPHVTVSARPVRLDAANARTLLSGHSHAADGCDSFATRLAVADAAQALAIPLVSGAVGPFDGQVATFRGHEPDLPCYRCLVGAAVDRDGLSCADTGVIGALTGVIGAMMALEVIREITGFGESLAGRLLLYDAMGARMRTVRLPKDPACPGCGLA
ncbi:HesA/MoeB/ThiF family protein [Polymorphobacter fuscus]|uniref:Molybdopterin-synthase adenylyltransferase MoeB n=1 Tax=Sandarakinorhabdus fusca TaxID=1439888 RepID=A0A7C9GQQ6_9SPHN|nr:molybdopterin-synthase adenylyltransferase MoeB [Polymorphobacter fuscus]KAB7644062.1 molybdopterin-synthase adenylyltransferase MoeB [Polymorphobacter fuscus]MQT18437.1 molybdopterin-synthase adenylyltransferase MoeB [Polymorphobacter fuscus]NJC08443.1 adenylyltransferase/sulfurtransferase [Polymorphobacter fuscus]